MTGRSDFHRLLGDVNVGQLFELVVHRRQALEDLLGRKARGNVQVHATVRSATTGLDLRVNRAGDFVTRQQLWRTTVVVGVGVPAVGFFFGFRVLLAEHVGDVVEHEALAFRVLQHTTVTANGLGDQDALDRRRPDHAGGVELQELHVDQGTAGAHRESVTVAGVLPRVRRDAVRLADTAGGQDDGCGVEGNEVAGLTEVTHATGNCAVLGENLLD